MLRNEENKNTAEKYIRLPFGKNDIFDYLTTKGTKTTKKL